MTGGIPASQGMPTWQRPQLLTGSPNLFSTYGAVTSMI